MQTKQYLTYKLRKLKKKHLLLKCFYVANQKSTTCAICCHLHHLNKMEIAKLEQEVKEKRHAGSLNLAIYSKQVT